MRRVYARRYRNNYHVNIPIDGIVCHVTLTSFVRSQHMLVSSKIKRKRFVGNAYVQVCEIKTATNNNDVVRQHRNLLYWIFARRCVMCGHWWCDDNEWADSKWKWIHSINFDRWRNWRERKSRSIVKLNEGILFRQICHFSHIKS